MIAIGYSVVILLLFMGILFGVSYLFNKLQAKGKFLKVALGTYFALLLISVIVYYVLPIESSSGEVKNEEEIPFLYDYLNKGTLDELDSSYRKNQWAYSYQGEMLEVQANVDDYFGFPIYVEKVPSEKLEIFHYQTPTIVDGYPLNVNEETAMVDLTENILTIHYQYYGEQSYAIFKPAFPFRAYTDVQLIPDEFQHGDELIYIQVPEHVDIIFNEKSGIQMIDNHL